MADVYMPEQRNSLSKFASLFQQGSSMLKSGSEGWESGKSLLGKMTGGGSTGGGIGEAAIGGAAGKYGLGLKFGNVAAQGAATSAPETAAASTSFMDVAGSAAPYAAPVAAGYGTYRDYKETGGQNSGPIGTSPRSREQTYGSANTFMKAGRDINAEANRFGKTVGLNLTDEQPDRMGSIERRYNSQQTAKRDIEEAQKSLDVAGLPTEERRSIAQKLEKARQQLGGKNRGSANYT
jgi:hypothetical protein